MKQLKISTAGIRGVVGQGMDAEVAMRFAQAFSTYMEGEPILLARDTRPSGMLMRSAVLAGTLACGSEVVDLGVVPSPTVQRFLAERKDSGAGIIIAAGHNPSNWNALKFLRSDGAYLNARQGAELLEIYNHDEFLKAGWKQIKPLRYDDDSIGFHKQEIRNGFGSQALQSRRFKVAVDCCNGTCSKITPALLESLGCEVIALNTDPGRPFPHDPNPTPANMNQLEALVRAVGADIGFAHDIEGERLGIVTNEGTAVSQEVTLGLAALFSLESGFCSGPIVTNLSTSRLIDEIAAPFGVAVHRSAIGQAHVVELALQLSADFAGEGSGQVMFPKLHPGSDGIAAVVFILANLARRDEDIATIIGQLPRFHMIKENVLLASDVLYRKIQVFRSEAEKREQSWKVDLTDGIKMESHDGWIHVRASSTESMLRIITESPERAKAEELHRWAHDLLVE